MFRTPLILILATVLLMGCGDETSNNGQTNNGQTNNGQTNNGQTSNGVPDDTCSGGDNMSNIRIVASLERDGESAYIRIAWDAGTEQGATLPPSYFEPTAAALISGPATNQLLGTVERIADNEIRVRFTGDPAGLYELELRFADRRTAIDCTHGGMDDVYVLVATIDFAGDGSVVSSTFEQSVELGDV